MAKKSGMTYASSGVDINAGNKAVELIKKRAQQTFRHYQGKVLSGIGGFSGIVELPDGRVMGTSIDGVGTKLMLAILSGKNDTVGEDLVAMCVNDLIVAGITPSVFLDYIAMGEQSPERTSAIVNGIINGCEMAECALLGGEMAEMPGMYGKNEYDLAGFALGFAPSQASLILGDKIKSGMKVFGLPSRGLHSNGYSLARKVCGIDLKHPKRALRIMEKYEPRLGCTVGEELLKPTTIYVKAVKKLLARYEIAGMAHITGGGLIENPPRILPKGCGMVIGKKTWPIPPIFDLIQKKGQVPFREMMRTFNNGIGLIIVSPDDIECAHLIGKIVGGRRQVHFI